MTFSLFPLGQCVATPGALAFLAQVPCGVLPLLTRHSAGDFGDITPEERARNLQAIEDGGRIHSVYQFAHGRVWIITEADRSATTALLPSEY